MYNNRNLRKTRNTELGIKKLVRIVFIHMVDQLRTY